MRTRIGLFVLLACDFGFAQDVNVLSYYAVNNTLDGQPMIGMANMLRFYPVYAMRKDIVWVNVTVYYGPTIYSRRAHDHDEGLYWQVLLPEFRLGEAIQRVEVEVRFSLDGRLIAQLSRIDSAIAQLRRSDGLLQEEARLKKEDRIANARAFFGETQDFLRREFGLEPAKAQAVRALWNSIGSRDSLQTWLDRFSTSQRISLTPVTEQQLIDKLDLMTSVMNKNRREITAEREYEQALAEMSIITLRNLDSLQAIRDSVISTIADRVEIGYTDTLFSGLSVRKSDLVVEDDFQHAKILYRNYKSSLRRMPALDPAEKLGIFRIRYVPFPIVGTASRTSLHLERPMSSESPTVFEIGLAFGDAIVPGDEFVIPEFSWRRLGIAFAITEQLFSDEASILGIALTYDFNSYGSLGVGGNFADSRIRGYASFGINKKAFEAVVTELSRLF